jgi:hypothetical protein
MGGDKKSRILVKHLTGSDLGWFGAARRSGAALGNQRGITLDSTLLKDLFGDGRLAAGELTLDVGRVREQPSPRPIRRQQKNWRLVGSKVEGEQLEHLGPGDLFVARFDVGDGTAHVAWQVCHRDSSAYAELEALCDDEPAAWFKPESEAWELLVGFLRGGDELATGDDRVDPAPGALIESLRGLGYSLPTAVADLIDNCIAAGARNVWLDFIWKGTDSLMVLRDDGRGMNLTELREAMRVGSKSPTAIRASSDLGRFGLGLKTASFSQARRLTVETRAAPGEEFRRIWDLDEVVKRNSWTLLPHPSTAAKPYLSSIKDSPSGTVVVWERLDRILGNNEDTDVVGLKRFLHSVAEVSGHLSMVFHSWLEPEEDEQRINIFVNGQPVVAWDPFHEALVQTESVPESRITRGSQKILARGFVLPHHDSFADEDELHGAGGPKGWYGQQGFYVYRHRRLLVAGSWLGLGSPRAWQKEQQTRLARIRLDLPNTMDDEWHIDLKKSAARPPAWTRTRLEDYAEIVRSKARNRLVRRAGPGPTRPGGASVERAWSAQTYDGRTSYRIAKDHPLVARVLESTQDQDALRALLRLLEETIPVQQIWLTQADRPELAPKPFSGDLEAALLVLQDVYRSLRKSLSAEEAKSVVRNMEPFNSMPALFDRLEE